MSHWKKFTYSYRSVELAELKKKTEFHGLFLKVFKVSQVENIVVSQTTNKPVY